MSGGRGRRYGNEEEQSRKLFVGGLSFDTTDEKLQEYFAEWGTITDSIVIKEPMSKKSKGFGFVTYETEKEADACMDSRPHNLQGRTVDVKRAVSREESSRPGAHVSVKKVFVGGLKEHHTKEDVESFFEQHGAIESVEVMVDKATGKTRGFGFVTFTDYDTVDKLVAKRHYEIGGFKCEVKKALSRAEMDKAKADAEARASRSEGYGGGGGGGHGGYGGGFGGRGGGGGGGYGRPQNGYGAGNGGYGDGGYGGGRDAGYGGGYGGDGYGGGYNGGYDGYGNSGGGGGGGYGGYGGAAADYGGYGTGYGGASVSYGPMRTSTNYGQRSGGPYGGGYGSGGGQGYGSGGGQGYGAGGAGGYGGAAGGGGYGGGYGGGAGGGQGNYGGGRY